MSSSNKKTNGRSQDHFVLHPVGRELAERYLDQITLSKIDEARRQIAEAVGVNEDDHIRVEVEMLFLVSF